MSHLKEYLNTCISPGNACADPESFVRGGPHLIKFFLVDGSIEDPTVAINGLPSAR